jgi:hypothetical protein
METLKQTIKTLAAEQSSLKNQRKTVRFTGQRTLTPLEAYRKHQANRYELRHLYVAYNTIRSRPTPDEGDFSMSYVNDLMKQYEGNVK